MSQDIHSLLEDSRISAENLVKEMEEYRAARELHQAETDALTDVTAAIGEVLKQITPFKEIQMRRFQTILMIGTVLNFLLLIALLITLILRTG